MNDTMDTQTNPEPYPEPYTESPADSAPASAESTGGRHPVNIGHLVMGVAFAAMAVIWALFESGTVAEGDYRWLLPIPWLAAGAAGLAATLLPSRRGRSGQ